MKELILVRHAKSDWTNETVKDIDRPLNERGYYDAYQLSEWFNKEMQLPDLILSSPATRAINTAFIFCRSFGLKENIVCVNENLYESTLADYLNELSKIDDKVNRLMLFGHNPAITNCVNDLNTDMEFENIPTCGIVKLGFNYKHWRDVVQKKEGQLLVNKFPKSFK